jgi:hypothetical protein
LSASAPTAPCAPSKTSPTLPSTLALEKTTNPFLRFHDPDMTAFAANYLNRPHPPGRGVRRHPRRQGRLGRLTASAP